MREESITVDVVYLARSDMTGDMLIFKKENMVMIHVMVRNQDPPSPMCEDGMGLFADFSAS